MAAPVGVVISEWIGPPVIGISKSLKISNTALVGFGIVPCENWVIPPPTATLVE